MSHLVDVLIPTYNRPAALAVTLTSLAFQEFDRFRVVISDQTREYDVADEGVVKASARLLEAHGHPVEFFKHLPSRGMAEQRNFLLEQARAPYALFLDDDLILEPYVVRLMLEQLQAEGCGFAGSAVIGLSFAEDVRPHEQVVEFWEGPVRPETVRPDTPEWERYRLHNAANVYHLQQRLRVSPAQPRKYKVAWVGGCVLYDVQKLRAVGGFSFWKDLPANHCGEDVLAQQRVMAAYGGFGVLPSGVYHQELPTTVPDRQHNAPRLLSLNNHQRMLG